MLLRGAKEPAQHQSQQWSIHLKETFLIILFLAAIIEPLVASAWNPYEILGLSRDANSEDIKRAYRDLARKYHPDKTSSSENDSGKRFIEINKAFDILKDPAKRARYDQHGTVEEGRQTRGHGGGRAYDHHFRHPSGSWFSHNGRTFTFHTGGGPDSYFRRNSINSRQYFNEYMKDSKKRPFLIFFYADLCPSCHMLEATWVEVINELAKYNVGAFTVNVHMEPRLAHELGVSSIPHIACLLDGSLHHYYGSQVSQSSFVKFIKNLLPNNLVPLLKTTDDQDRHINQKNGQSSRLSAIIINDEKNLKLRYLLLAYSLRQYYRFGHVSTKLSDYKTLAQKYKLEMKYETNILGFDERLDRPKVHIKYEPGKFSMEKLTRDLMAWPFLRLPKLWSQQVFDDLCLYEIPKVGDRIMPRLCVVLFTTSARSSLPVREKMLEFIELNNLSQNKRVAFSYIDPKKQTDFVKFLMVETASTQPEFIQGDIQSTVLLIKRQPENSRKARYVWLQNRWDPSSPDDLDRARIEAHGFIRAYLEGAFELEHKLLLSNLVDEEGPTLMERIFSRLLSSTMQALRYVTTRESFSTVIMLIGCALLTSLFLYKSPVPAQYNSPENEFQYYRTAEPNCQMKSEHLSNTSASYSTMNIMELKAETYNGMLRSLRPGFRTIVLLTDQESKEKLLDDFKRSVWPYRKNRTLMFGYLCLDKNLAWYKEILERVLSCDGLNVNKKNCIGTVLSLNGFKKYFRVYHSKHHEIDCYDDRTDDGSFLGFNDDEDRHARDPELGNLQEDEINSQHAEICTIDNLLEKLPIWLDKMFDGLTKRYFVDDWPEEIN